jgi:nucleotide-binding universal stress UspA family protein
LRHDPFQEGIMSATALSPLAGDRHDVLAQVQHGPIVVATDGTIASDAALELALALGGIHRAKVILISVIEPVAVVPMDFGIALPFAEIDQALRQSRIAKVNAQLDRLGLSHAGWALHVDNGDPASVIAATAREWEASVIVTGLGNHELSDRFLGSETAIRTLRSSSVPVLAVSESTDTLPRRAVVATDFSIASLDAARAAIRLMPELTELHLVHVMSRLEVPPDLMVAWDGLYTEPIAQSFERLTSALDVPKSITIKTVTREGKSAREIVRYAQSISADLIVTGSRGAGFMTRLLVGSTATGIIRGADCAVLAVPATAGSDRLIGIEEMAQGAESVDRWIEQLSTFSRKNAGRRTSLEVDDPDYGLLVQEHGYPLLGVVYDRHDAKVSIMLGDLEGTRRHLTRGISDPLSIDILRDGAGRDQALRIAHGNGQTLLTLEN